MRRPPCWPRSQRLRMAKARLTTRTRQQRRRNPWRLPAPLERLDSSPDQRRSRRWRGQGAPISAAFAPALEHLARASGGVGAGPGEWSLPRPHHDHAGESDADAVAGAWPSLTCGLDNLARSAAIARIPSFQR